MSDSTDRSDEDGVSSDHGDDEVFPSSPRTDEGADLDRDPLELRPGRDPHVPRHARSDAGSGASQHGDISPVGDRFDDEDTPLVEPPVDPKILALIQASAHLHLPISLPDGKQLLELKEFDPQAYSTWMRLVEKRIEHDMWMERAPLEHPFKLAKRGQVGARAGLVVMAGLAGYAVYADHPWVAALFGVLDFVGVVAAFQGDDKREARGDRE